MLNLATLKKQARDQALHASTAMLVLLPPVLLHNAFAFAFSGFVCGMIREVTEAGLPVTWAKIKEAPFHSDARLDLSFWTIGGLLIGLIAGS